MVHIGTDMILDPVRYTASVGGKTGPIRHSVLVVRDGAGDNELLDQICEFLDIGVEHASSGDDLARILPELQPLAVIADVEGANQDGFHVMKVAADYNRSLPILLLNSNDTSLLGAVQAVQETWGLTRVATVDGPAEIGALVDFICQAARRGGRSQLMRT